MKDRIVAACRVTFGILVLGTFVYHLASRWGTPGFHVSNLLSYFTIQSNVLGGIVLLAAAARMARPPTATFEMVRGAATLYLVTTGVIYAVLLSGYDAIAQVTPPLVNLVMHQVMPIVMAVDWIINPPATRLDWRRSLLWLAYPLAYGAYSLVRGPIADWYPYPFLDPTRPGGYGRVLVTCVAVALALTALTIAIVWIGNRLRDHSAPPAPGRLVAARGRRWRH